MLNDDIVLMKQNKLAGLTKKIVEGRLLMSILQLIMEIRLVLDWDD